MNNSFIPGVSKNASEENILRFYERTGFQKRHFEKDIRVSSYVLCEMEMKV